MARSNLLAEEAERHCEEGPPRERTKDEAKHYEYALYQFVAVGNTLANSNVEHCKEGKDVGHCPDEVRKRKSNHRYEILPQRVAVVFALPDVLNDIALEHEHAENDDNDSTDNAKYWFVFLYCVEN